MHLTGIYCGRLCMQGRTESDGLAPLKGNTRLDRAAEFPPAEASKTSCRARFGQAEAQTGPVQTSKISNAKRAQSNPTIYNKTHKSGCAFFQALLARS